MAGKFEVFGGLKIKGLTMSRVYSHVTFGNVNSSRPFFMLLQEKWVSNPKVIFSYNGIELSTDSVQDHVDSILVLMSRTGKDMGVGKLYREMMAMDLNKELLVNTCGMIMGSPHMKIKSATYTPDNNIITVNLEHHVMA